MAEESVAFLSPQHSIENLPMSLGAVDLFQQLAQNDFGFFQKLQSVSAIMTREVQVLTLDHTYQQAADLFRDRGFRHAPIVEEGDIVGILSDRDLLRHRPPHLGTAGEGDRDQRALRTPISNLMTRRPLTVSEGASLESALTLMLHHHVDSLLVVDASNKLAGIVTPVDFMKTILLFHRVCGTPDLVRFRLVDLDMTRGLPLDLIFSRGARSVRDVMTKEVVTARKTETLAQAMELMQSRELRHLPVTADDGSLLGFVSDRHLLRSLSLPVPRPQPRGGEQRFRDRLFATQNNQAASGSLALVMDTDPPKIRPEALFVDAIRLMMEQRVSGLPVVDPTQGKVCGVITTTDVLRVFRVVLQIGSHLGEQQGLRAQAA